MTRRIELLGAYSPLPRGSIAVGVGIAVTAVASYIFLVLTARAVGPTEYGVFAVLWSMVYIASGAFSPLEQEVSRALAARRVSGQGGEPVVRRAAILGISAVLGIGLIVLLAAPHASEALLRGNTLLLLCLLIALCGQSAARLLGGTLSGSGRFGRYGAYLSLDAVIRLVLCVAFVAIGLTAAWPYALALAIAPLLAIPPALWRAGVLTGPGPEAPWRELSVALGSLLASSVLASALLYSPVVLLEALSGPALRSEVGVFNAALLLTRLPLVMFGAIQIALLPQLSGLAVARQLPQIAVVMTRTLAAVLVLLAVGSVAAFAIGSEVMALVYGGGYVADPRIVGILTVGTSAYIVALTLGQGLIALGAVSKVAWSWAVGLAVILLALTATDLEVIARVSVGYVLGCAAAALVMGVQLLLALRGDASKVREPVIDHVEPPPW